MALQIAIRLTPTPKKPSLDNLVGAVPESTIQAIRTISEALTKDCIRHTLVGGLAVGVYGWPRATRDVDFLVGSEIQRSPTPFTDAAMKAAGVPIDKVIPRTRGDRYLVDELNDPHWIDGVPVARPTVVVASKLARMEMRDQADVVELLKAKLIRPAAIRSYLEEFLPEVYIERFNSLVEQAQREVRATRKRGS